MHTTLRPDIQSCYGARASGDCHRFSCDCCCNLWLLPASMPVQKSGWLGPSTITEEMQTRQSGGCNNIRQTRQSGGSRITTKAVVSSPNLWSNAVGSFTLLVTVISEW
ncbi:unnamed protein product [Polarella glacialis]|uniref:Uncharacterized protein n=1 Tax=Polarella glacialis TaxID=89957 RepID=A0A813F7U7_POLGL|nr:unnamed protein product [Polarella glacialis]